MVVGVMTFFHLVPRVDDGDALVDFDGRRDRLVEHFVFGGDGPFLSFMTPRARAHPGAWTQRIGELDYLESTSPIPLFSPRFRAALGHELVDDIAFAERIVQAGDREYAFFAGHVLRSLDLVDPDSSTSRTPSDGSTSLMVLGFRDPSRADFYLARDRAEPFALIATDAMRLLCEQRGLTVDFVPYSMGGAPS